jgi:hypothetical protein
LPSSGRDPRVQIVRFAGLKLRIDGKPGFYWAHGQFFAVSYLNFRYSAVNL